MHDVQEAPCSGRSEIHAGHTPASKQAKKESTRHGSEIHPCPANSHGGEDTIANPSTPKCTENMRTESAATAPPRRAVFQKRGGHYRHPSGVSITTGYTAKTVLPNGQNWRKSCGAVKARKATFAPKFLSATNLCYTPLICQCPCHLHARRPVHQAPGGPNKCTKHQLPYTAGRLPEQAEMHDEQKGPQLMQD